MEEEGPHPAGRPQPCTHLPVPSFPSRTLCASRTGPQTFCRAEFLAAHKHNFHLKFDLVPCVTPTNRLCFLSIPLFMI